MTTPPLRVLFAASIVLQAVVGARQDSLGEQNGANAAGSPGVEDATKAASKKPPEPKDVLRVNLNQEFALGDYSYKITRVRWLGQITYKGTSPTRHFTAPNGAIYLVIDYVMRYDGKETVPARPCSFRVLGSEEREYKPDDTVLEVVRGSGHVIRSNQPGVSRPTYTVFLVPQNASPFTLTVRENTEKPNLKMAALDLQFNAASITLTPTPKPKHTNKKPTARHNTDDITSEQRELWRRMDRPFGTPWRSFSAPDQNNYPNN